MALPIMSKAEVAAIYAKATARKQEATRKRDLLAQLDRNPAQAKRREFFTGETVDDLRAEVASLERGAREGRKALAYSGAGRG